MSTEDLSPIEQFAETHAAKTDLEARLEGAPEVVRGLYVQGIDAANEKLAELAERPGVKKHYLHIGGTVLAAAKELEETASVLESLGLGDQLKAKKEELETQLRDKKVAAASYFFAEPTASGVAFAPAQPARSTGRKRAASRSADQQQPARSEDTPDKRTLTIRIDPNNNISINGRAVSLNRETQAAGKSNLGYGRELRVKALKFLAENPGMHMRGPICEAIGLNATSSEGQAAWTLHVKSFLEDAPTFGGKPLITADTSVIKRYKYGVTSFNLLVEHTQKTLRPRDETIFTVAEGREVGGKTGKLLNLMARASEDRPVTDKEVEDLYTPEERSKYNDETIGNALSGLVSSARRELIGTDWVVKKILTDQVNPASGRKRPGYYMVEDAELAQREALAREKAKNSSESESAGEAEAVDAKIKAAAAEAEIDPKDPLTLHEAHVLAFFLNANRDDIAARGLMQLPVEIYEALDDQIQKQLASPSQSKKMPDARRVRCHAFQKCMELMLDNEKLNLAIDAYDAQQDPRQDLLILLNEYASGEDAQGDLHFLYTLLESQPSITYAVDAGRYGSFQVETISKSDAR